MGPRPGNGEYVFNLLHPVIGNQAIEGDRYLSLSQSGKGLFKDRGSKFIGLAFPVDNPEEAQSQWQALRKTYHDAQHHCYAFRTKPLAPEVRFNDDGEPAHSAGTPIFNQILAADLWNVLVVVVRYFGGSKLGVPGLINAYKTAAQEALLAAPKRKVQLSRSLIWHFPYQKMGEAMELLRGTSAQIEKEEMSGQEAGFALSVPLGNWTATFKHLEKLKHGRLES